MRILYLGNNWLGYQVLKWLREQGEDIVGLVMHPEPQRKYGDEIVACSGLDRGRIFSASNLTDQAILDAIRRLQPDIGISTMFGYILKKEFLSIFPKGVINLHPAYLPYNKGAYPNVWCIVEGTPAGVTIHYVDSGIDTGDIIARREVKIEPIDTGKTLYHKLEQAMFDLFIETWPSLKSGHMRIKQTEEGTYHRTNDVEVIDRIDLDKEYRAGDLINILRARTFPPYPGAYFEVDGRRAYIRVELFYDDSLAEDQGN